jgi:hypothetical protein
VSGNAIGLFAYRPPEINVSVLIEPFDAYTSTFATAAIASSVPENFTVQFSYPEHELVIVKLVT